MMKSANPVAYKNPFAPYRVVVTDDSIRRNPDAIDVCSDEPLTARDLKNFGYAAITIAGAELLRRIRKNQFALSRLASRQVDSGDLERRARRLRDCISSRLRSFRKTQNFNRTSNGGFCRGEEKFSARS
jgi:hypothetical protein